ncbi:ABC transporter permease [Propionigenium maris]|uniref:ABC transporter permease n=1 Tax=Propionigenium maris TaxID=45622 RepID=UPI0024908F1C|nr:ABC transporter permease [Propionigenium maris]
MNVQVKDHNLIIGGGILSFLLLIMGISFFYLPHSVTEIHTSLRLSPPSSSYLLGTDNFGRDILSRLMKGSQTAFLVGVISVSIGSSMGVFLGAVSGYFGGRTDEIIMRIIDAMMAFPGILFALMFISVFGVGIENTMIAIGIMSIPTFARITRSGFLREKELEYVRAARVRGASNLRIIYHHILPNVLSPVIVAATMSFSNAILAEAALSYLGLGVQAPNPSWGRMLSESQMYFMTAPWYTLAPGIMISLTVLALNMLGDFLRGYQKR